MVFQYDEGSSKVLVYFHGNAEDVGLASELLDHLGSILKLHILAVEYPGYGIYRSKEVSDLQIEEDSLRVFDYLTQSGFETGDILIFGRSIGSGPAVHLCSKRKPAMLTLMSPFKSIKEVAGNLVGKWAKWMVSEKFNNLKRIESVDCPVLIIHGL